MFAGHSLLSFGIVKQSSLPDTRSFPREHLTLELAILSERKTAKIIFLLEELRQAHPDIQDRIDDEAAVMSEPANPQSVLEALNRQTAESG